MAMDKRTAKRYASEQHIKQQWYYRPGVIDDELDPFDENCPTRRWRYKMRVWVLGMKRTLDRDQRPQNEDAAATSGGLLPPAQKDAGPTGTVERPLHVQLQLERAKLTRLEWVGVDNDRKVVTS